MITPTEIKQNEQIRTYIEKADEALAALGYTEHSYAHVTRVAHFAEKIMADLGYPRRMQELAWIAGYMHDIGNVINRIDHAQSGAVMAFRILDKLGMPADEIATVCSAIGNHDESTAFPVNAVAAALIFRFLRNRPASKLLLAQGASGLVAEAVMVAGYFGYSCLWLGKGLAAAASIPGNVVQGALGLVTATAIYVLLNRSSALARI